MNDIHAKQTEMKNTFISVRKVFDFIFESLSKDIDKQTNDNHVLNTMNLRFFKNQTCLVKDGYDLEIIKIDKESQPSYQDLQKAMVSYSSGKPSPLLDEYGFSRKKTLDNLQSMGVNIPNEMILMAKSFVPNNNCWYDEINYGEFLPSEYMVLLKENERLKSEALKPTADHASTAELHARIAELESEITAKDKRIAELERVGGGQILKYGIDKVNYDKEIAKKFACIVAKSIWGMDETQKIRINDMTTYIQGLLLDFSPNDMPETNETLSLWLKEIKPDYATRAGRTPKDAPKKIPLTFKK